MSVFEVINPIEWDDSMLTSSSVVEDDYPVWAAGAAITKGTRKLVTGKHRIYEATEDHTSAAAASATVTISVATPGVITWNAHGLAAGAEVVFTTTGVLPTGIVSGTTYYVVSPATNTFSVAATRGGAAIATSGTPSGTHTATVGGNQPDISAASSTPKWVDIGPTNKFAAFDNKRGTQTKATGSITMQITPGQAIDSIGLLNMRGSQVVVTQTVGGVEKYSKTLKLISNIGVYDWLTYFTAKIVTQHDLKLTDLKPYYNQVITITITGPGEVAIGNVSMGANIVIGKSLSKPRFGGKGFTKKTVDEFGSYVATTKRPTAKTFSCTVLVEKSFVDQIGPIMDAIDGIPVVYSAGVYSSLVAWGFFVDWEVAIEYETHSILSITVEGLT